MLRVSFLLVAAGCLCTLAAQDEPFKVHDTRPVITSGPFLLAPTESSMAVIWMTDTPCHSKIVYGTGGSLNLESEPQAHGLVPISTRHAVNLTGLEPGRTYKYKVVSTRVVKMRSYWPEKGLSVESPVYSFTTFDRGKRTFSFSVITDTHSNLARIDDLVQRVDWEKMDLLVHLGDAFDSETEDTFWPEWLDPLTKALAHRKPLLYARGNHETRGPAARMLMDYVAIPEGRFYYARDHGPVHFILLDTGEDKPDSTNVYSGLNRFTEYRKQEVSWLENHLKTDPRVARAPFRILAMHMPEFGAGDNLADRFKEVAKTAAVDLVVSGHTHRYAHTAAPEGTGYHHLILGPENLARIEVSDDKLDVTVTAKGGAPVTSFIVPRRQAGASD